jgi:ApaG protein
MLFSSTVIALAFGLVSLAGPGGAGAADAFSCASPGCVREIPIEVDVVFLDDLSAPAEQRYAWAYQVTIRNRTDVPVTLMRRYWRVINGMGSVEEIAGDGVLGLQPLIEPAGMHRYTSWVVLTTPQGLMEGHYELEASDARVLRARIPPFELTM